MGIGDEAAVVSNMAWGISRQRLVDVECVAALETSAADGEQRVGMWLVHEILHLSNANSDVQIGKNANIEKKNKIRHD